jgi:hypothetical protein
MASMFSPETARPLNESSPLMPHIKNRQFYISQSIHSTVLFHKVQLCAVFPQPHSGRVNKPTEEPVVQHLQELPEIQ